MILVMSHKENCYAHLNNVTSVRHAAPRPRCPQPRHCCKQTSLAHASNSRTHAQAWAKMTARRLVPAEESPNTASSFRSVNLQDRKTLYKQAGKYNEFVAAEGFKYFKPNHVGLDSETDRLVAKFRSRIIQFLLDFWNYKIEKRLSFSTFSCMFYPKKSRTQCLSFISVLAGIQTGKKYATEMLRKTV